MKRIAIMGKGSGDHKTKDKIGKILIEIKRWT